VLVFDTVNICLEVHHIKSVLFCGAFGLCYIKIDKLLFATIKLTELIMKMRSETLLKNASAVIGQCSLMFITLWMQ
jgi:hypothetical protein